MKKLCMKHVDGDDGIFLHTKYKYCLYLRTKPLVIDVKGGGIGRRSEAPRRSNLHNK